MRVLYTPLEVIDMYRALGCLSAVVLLLTLCTASAVQAATTVKIIHYGPGNEVRLYGGDKPQSIRQSGLTTAPQSATLASAWGAIKSLSATKSTYYGDSRVQTAFSDTVYVNIPHQYIEVEGSTTTIWLGWDPQYNSSKITLGEVWTFGGIFVTVSASGPGFSTSSKTASWFGDDTSGDNYGMGHLYAGISGESLFPLTSVNHAANGSHYFDATNMWVSANARKGITSL
jgi:hypothetical protein